MQKIFQMRTVLLHDFGGSGQPDSAFERTEPSEKLRGNGDFHADDKGV